MIVEDGWVGVEYAIRGQKLVVLIMVLAYVLKNGGIAQLVRAMETVGSNPSPSANLLGDYHVWSTRLRREKL